MKFSVKDFFSKCEQILKTLWTLDSHLLKKSFMENVFRVVRNILYSKLFQPLTIKCNQNVFYGLSLQLIRDFWKFSGDIERGHWKRLLETVFWKQFFWNSRDDSVSVYSAGNYMFKLTIETLEQHVKCVQS